MQYPPTRKECQRFAFTSKIYRGINLASFIAALVMLLISGYLYFEPAGSILNQSSIAMFSLIAGVCVGAISWDQIKVQTKNISWAECHLIKGCRN